MALNSRLQTYQILTNDDQMLILCLSIFINTVTRNINGNLAKMQLNKKVNALSEKISSHFAAVVEEIACQLGRVTFERKMLEPFLLYA